VALAVVGMVADVLGPALITERPLLQIALNPRNRYLVLGAVQIAVVPFFVVAFVRLVLTDPLFYVLGRQYGDGALDWVERQTGGAGTIPMLVRWFSKASHVVLVVAPSGYVCLLAGATGMGPRIFAALNVLGTVGRLILIWFLAAAVEDTLLDIVSWVQRYQWWLVGASFLLVSLQSRRKAERGELESPAAIEQEILEAEARQRAPEAGDGPPAGGG
jgi:membrane protein DedA with SNARE-associated domain